MKNAKDSGWIYGTHSVKAVLERRPKEVSEVVVAGSAELVRAGAPAPLMKNSIAEEAKKHGIRVREMSPREIGEMTGSDSHQGVAARAKLPTCVELEDVMVKEGPSSIVVLDSITDPQNFGAICRTAEALGIGGIVIAQDRSASMSASAHKASSGALEWIKVAMVVNLSRALRDLKEAGYWIYGADAEGQEDFAKVDFDARSVLVVGSEGKGIRPGVRKEIDFTVRIPLRGKTSSLNAGTACAIVMSRMARPGG